MTDFDWAAMLRIGLQNLGLKPDEFWALTPLEFLIISGLHENRSAMMTRLDFEALSLRFPDKKME